jgi:hypothetical protein
MSLSFVVAADAPLTPVIIVNQNYPGVWNVTYRSCAKIEYKRVSKFANPIKYRTYCRDKKTHVENLGCMFIFQKVEDFLFVLKDLKDSGLVGPVCLEKNNIFCSCLVLDYLPCHPLHKLHCCFIEHTHPTSIDCNIK